MKQQHIIILLVLIISLFGITANAEVSLQEAVELTETQQSFDIKLKFAENMDITDRISILILKPGYTFEDDLKDAICYAGASTGLSEEETKTFRYKFNSENHGIYTIRLALMDKSGNVNVWQEQGVVISPQSSYLSDFNNTSAENFDTTLSYYINTEPIIEPLRIAEPLTGLGEYFVYARENMLDEFNSISDIYNALETAVLLKSLETQSSEEILQKLQSYSDNIPEIFPNDMNMSVFADMFKGESNVHNLKHYVALSYIKGGTYQDISDAITKYHNELGVNVNYIQSLGISISDVAKMVDNKLPEAVISDFGTYIKNIADGIYKNNQVLRPQGGGNGGGGGGGSKVSAVPSISPIAPENNKITSSYFSDIESVPWAKDAILELADAYIISGVSENIFEPQRPVTRAEFVKLLVAAFSLTDTKDIELHFDDCKLGDWYYPYIKAAVSNNILQGLGNGQVGAGLYISRQDAAVMCKNVLDTKLKLSKVNSPEFSDSYIISGYAKDAVAMLSTLGILKGTENNEFLPLGETTRAEAAVIVSRLMDAVK